MHTHESQKHVGPRMKIAGQDEHLAKIAELGEEKETDFCPARFRQFVRTNMTRKKLTKISDSHPRESQETINDKGIAMLKAMPGMPGVMRA